MENGPVGETLPGFFSGQQSVASRQSSVLNRWLVANC
jgi:hypothetical protein